MEANSKTRFGEWKAEQEQQCDLQDHFGPGLRHWLDAVFNRPAEYGHQVLLWTMSPGHKLRREDQECQETVGQPLQEGQQGVAAQVFQESCSEFGFLHPPSLFLSFSLPGCLKYHFHLRRTILGNIASTWHRGLNFPEPLFLLWCASKGIRCLELHLLCL